MNDPMTWVAAWLAGTSIYALNGWRRARRAGSNAKASRAYWEALYWERNASCLHYSDDRNTFKARAIDLENALRLTVADTIKASARADHYASSWGRVMKLLRIAQKANKELRDAQMRREMADNIDRMAA